MGSCLCKGRDRSERRQRRAPNSAGRSAAVSKQSRGTMHTFRNGSSVSQLPTRINHNADPRSRASSSVSTDVKDLIRDTLAVIRDLVNNDQEPPPSLLKLNVIADKEEGWSLVVRSLISEVPIEDSLGPAVITLFLDESPLPTKEAVSRLISRLSLSSSTFHNNPCSFHRNACIVIGSLAEKMAGAGAVSLCSQSILQYLMDNLNPNRPTQVILFSLIALEKLAQTTENRLLIVRMLQEADENPLEVLESWMDDSMRMRDCDCKQAAFCAQWSLDNIFVSNNRTFACMRTDVSGIHAMLNHKDVSEYLKIGPDGLNARCDVSSFESVRCTFEVPQDRKGVWYYEATILTAGVMQIGLASKRSRFLNHEGYGIGDDDYSIAYDGCRQLIWTAAKGIKNDQRAWKAGDTVGCLIDLSAQAIVFTLNGVMVGTPQYDFLSRLSPNEGVFAAASFMSFQQCIFNFGATPFAFPPSGHFLSFNQGGARLTQEEKTILPRRRRIEMLEREPILDDACTICCSRKADTVTAPCMHEGLCSECAMQMESCPFCRVPIQLRLPVSSHRTELTTTV